jgi:hypothetical protein
MSKACSNGTPAFIIVASWRVKIAMSFCLIDVPPAHAALLHLGDQDALAAQAGADHGFAAGTKLAAHDLAVAVLAFPLEDGVLGFFGSAAVAMKPPTGAGYSACCGTRTQKLFVGDGDHFLERGHAQRGP